MWAMMEGESNKKRREKDEEDDQNCYDDEVIDPSHKRFLDNLKEDGKSYIFEYEDDGVPLKIKYEGELSLDDECDVEEPVRKLRSATKVINRLSDQKFGVEDQHKRETGKKKANKLKSKKEENTKSSNKIALLDCDYYHFCQHTKVSKKDDMVYEYGGLEIPYWEEFKKTNVDKKKNEESFPGVEIIDPDTFYMEDEKDTTEAECSDGSSSEDEEEISKMNKGSVSDLKFRRKAPNDLRKPSNKQEGRHLNLHNGRGRSYSTTKEGKSYLDHYPVVGQINRSSDQMLGVEDQRKREIRKKQANKLKNKKEDSEKASNNFVPDPEYIAYLEILKANGGHSMTSEEVSRKYNPGKKENAGYFPGVEIIDPDTFYKEGTRGSSSKDEEEISKMSKDSDDPDLEFRQQVLNDLRKPYNKQEHEKLLQDFKVRRQEGRHLDLRNGRERSYSTTKEGKSYLDHYPVFGRKLAQVQHDELKSLNLLRGFFRYIQQSEPPFRPWDDEECCAITPVSAMNGDRSYRDKPESSKTSRRTFSWIQI